MKALVVFSIPLIIGNFFQQTYTMVDALVVGRYVSEDALAAIGASYAFTNIFIWMAVGGGIGASVIVSHHFGARRYGEMRSAVYTALLSFLAVSLVLCGLGFLVGRPIMTLLRTPASAMEPAMVYLKIYFLGLPFLFMYNVISAMFNAIGMSRIPLYFLIFSSVLNIGLDVWMVVSLGLGVAGVAWATLIAQGLSAVISFLVLRRTVRRFGPDQEAVLFSLREAGKMMAVAIPSIVQQSTVSIGMMIVQSVVNGFGASALAGYSAGMRIENYCCVPWGAFNNAMSSYTAQNIGSGKDERVRQGYKAVLVLIAIFSAAMFLIMEPLAGTFVRMFLGRNLTEEALRAGTSYIRCDGIFVGILGVKMAQDALLRGAQDTRAFTIANLVNLGIRIILSFTLAPVVGIQMVWYASPIGWTANYLISWSHLRKTKYGRKAALKGGD